MNREELIRFGDFVSLRDFKHRKKNDTIESDFNFFELPKARKYDLLEKFLKEKNDIRKIIKFDGNKGMQDCGDAFEY